MICAKYTSFPISLLFACLNTVKPIRIIYGTILFNIFTNSQVDLNQKEDIIESV